MFEWIIRGSSLRLLLLLIPSLLSSTALMAESVAVRYKEGVAHGFLVLRTPDGKPIADGESTQVSQGDRVTTHMWFKFKDGSVYDQKTVFSQRGTFHLLSDHVVQKGPAFRRRLETTIDATRGEVTVRYTDEHSQERVTTKHLELPADVANGIVFTLLKNVQPNVPMTTVSYVAATPKPRLVKLEIIHQGLKPFSIGSQNHKALLYSIKVNIGGLTGAIVSLMGKRPPDTQAWVLTGEAPAFARADGPLFGEGAIFRMEVAVPAVWPDSGSLEMTRPSTFLIQRNSWSRDQTMFRLFRLETCGSCNA